MSKCREAFEHYCDDEGIISEQYKEEIVEVWQAAWNAALDRAIEIVEEQEGCITDSSALLIRREKTE